MIGTIKGPLFKFFKNEKLSTYFKNVICACEDRLTKARLTEVISIRYPGGHTD